MRPVATPTILPMVRPADPLWKSNDVHQYASYDRKVLTTQQTEPAIRKHERQEINGSCTFLPLLKIFYARFSHIPILAITIEVSLV